MWKWWIRSLALSLGLSVTVAGAREPGGPVSIAVATREEAPQPVAIAVSKPANPTPAPAPVQVPAISPPTNVAARPSSPFVSIGRPVSIASSRQEDTGIKPVAYSGTALPGPVTTPVNSVAGVTPNQSPVATIAVVAPPRNDSATGMDREARGPIIRGSAPENDPRFGPANAGRDPSVAGLHSWRPADSITPTSLRTTSEPSLPPPIGGQTLPPPIAPPVTSSIPLGGSGGVALPLPNHGPTITPPVVQTPLGGTPLGGTPLGGTPLGTNPFGGAPVLQTPLGGTPLSGQYQGGTVQGPYTAGSTQLGSPQSGPGGEGLPIANPFPPPTIQSGPQAGTVVGAPPVGSCGTSLFATNPAAGGAGGHCAGGCGAPTSVMPPSSHGGSGGWFAPGGDVGGPRLTLGAEMLLWWINGDHTPALVSIADPANPTGTFFGDPNSTVVAGNSRMGGGRGMPGLRLFGTYWFSDERLWGIDLGGFALFEDEQQMTFASNGSPRIGRPIIDQAQQVNDGNGGLVNNGLFGRGNAELVAGPIAGIVIPGGVTVTRKSSLWGFDANLRRNLCSDDGFSFDLLFGYRQLGLDESLEIRETLFVPPIGTTPSTVLQVMDRFSTQNRFYGGQIGFDTYYRAGDWTFGLKSKVAIGCTQQLVQIDGSSSRTQGGLTTTGTGGLLALNGTNIGQYTRTTLGIVPEVGLTVGYNLSDRWRLTGGYNFLYWNSVARPGEQINLNVNRNFQPFVTPPAQGLGARQPEPIMRSSDFFAHGFTLGMEFRY